MATRAELVGSLNTYVPSTVEVCVKVGEAYFAVDLSKVSQVMLFKRTNGRLAIEGKVDDALKTFVCIPGVVV